MTGFGVGVGVGVGVLVAGGLSTHLYHAPRLVLLPIPRPVLVRTDVPLLEKVFATDSASMGRASRRRRPH